MSPIQVITVLLPLITLATAQYRYFASKDPKPKLLEINAACNFQPNPETFCMGAKGKDTWFGGDGCFKDSSCESIFHATKNADAINWYLVMKPEKPTQFFLDTKLNNGKVPPNMVYNDGSPKPRYTDKDSKVEDIDDVETAYKAEKFFNDADWNVFWWTSKDVIEFKDIGYKVNAAKDELFPVMIKQVKNSNDLSTLHQPTKAMKLFVDQKVPDTGNPPTGGNGGTKVQSTAKPSKASRLAIEQITGLIAFAATVAFLKFLM